jgi:hypothetical protein
MRVGYLLLVTHAARHRKSLFSALCPESGVEKASLGELRSGVEIASLGECVQSLVGGTSWALVGFVGSRGSIEKVHRLRCQGTGPGPSYLKIR